jgi:hypothetical protein
MMRFKRQNSAKGFKDKEKEDFLKQEAEERLHQGDDIAEGKNLRELMDDLKMWKSKFSNTKGFLVEDGNRVKTPEPFVKQKFLPSTSNFDQNNPAIEPKQSEENTLTGRHRDLKDREGQLQGRFNRSPVKSDNTQVSFPTEQSMTSEVVVQPLEKSDKKNLVVREVKQARVRKNEFLENYQKRKDVQVIQGPLEASAKENSQDLKYGTENLDKSNRSINKSDDSVTEFSTVKKTAMKD